jgi:hypothetical protein
VPARRARDLVVGGGATAAEALALLPYYVAERASVTRVDEIEIP